MSEWPAVPEAFRERLADVEQLGGKGVGEVFYGSHLREGCPECGNDLLLRTVYHTVDGDPDVPISQQTKEEIAHEYLCSGSEGHDDQYRWLVDVEGPPTWYLEKTTDSP